MTINPEDLVFTIHQTHDWLRSCEDKVFGEQGLTPEQYAVLMSVKCLDEPVRMTDVARRLIRSVNSISMIADRMVKAGLLTRERDGKDRREVRLIITSKAEPLFEAAILAGKKFAQDNILSRLSYEDRQTLLELLLTVQLAASEYRDRGR